MAHCTGTLAGVYLLLLLSGILPAFSLVGPVRQVDFLRRPGGIYGGNRCTTSSASNPPDVQLTVAMQGSSGGTDGGGWNPPRARWNLFGGILGPCADCGGSEMVPCPNCGEEGGRYSFEATAARGVRSRVPAGYYESDPRYIGSGDEVSSDCWPNCEGQGTQTHWTPS